MRKKAAPVEKIDAAILQLIEDMRETMYHEPGCGLAAPQIGVSLRVVVYDSPENKDGFQVLINPQIVRSEGQQKGPEACLSIPDISADVVRASSIRVEGLRPDGGKISLDLQDFTARILQHEIDHINGILFIDRVSLTDKSAIDKKLKKLRKNAPAL